MRFMLGGKYSTPKALQECITNVSAPGHISSAWITDRTFLVYLDLSPYELPRTCTESLKNLSNGHVQI